MGSKGRSAFGGSGQRPVPDGGVIAMVGLKSGFAQIDVTGGRKALEKRLRAGEEVVVTVTVRLDTDSRAWNDDGVSTSFSGEVLHLAEVVPTALAAEDD